MQLKRPPQSEEALFDGFCYLIVVGFEFYLVQGRDDLFAQELDGAHGVRVFHSALVAVAVEVARAESLADLLEIPGEGLGSFNDEVCGRPRCLSCRWCR